MSVVLIGVVIAGVVINAAMVWVTVRRWLRFDPVFPTDDKLGDIKERIGWLTLRRALRLEVTFLLCQLARLAHTFYVIFVIKDQVDLPAALERSFVTFMLIYLSVADLITRNRIAAKIDTLHPNPQFPPLL